MKTSKGTTSNIRDLPALRPPVLEEESIKCGEGLSECTGTLSQDPDRDAVGPTRIRYVKLFQSFVGLLFSEADAAKLLPGARCHARKVAIDEVLTPKVNLDAKKTYQRRPLFLCSWTPRIRRCYLWSGCHWHVRLHQLV